MLTVSRFSYVVMAADQIVTVAASIRFQYDDGHTFISWATGMNPSPALWISVFLVVVIIVNMIPVKVSCNRIRCAAALTRYGVLWGARVHCRVHQDYVYLDADHHDAYIEPHEA